MATGSRTRGPTKASDATVTKAKAEAHRALGTGRHRDAIRLLEGVVERAPEEWAAVQQLGDLYTRAGRKGPANVLYRRLADHFEEEGHQARAAAMWGKILRNDSSFLGARLKIGALYADMGRRVEAREHYEVVLAAYRKQEREGEAGMIEGLLAELNGAARPRPSTDSSPEPESPAAPQPEAAPDEGAVGPVPEPGSEAASDPGAVEKAEPTSAGEADFVEERLFQGRMFRRFGLVGQARAELELVLEREPGNVEALEELRDLLHDQGEMEAAAEHQRKLAEIGAGASGGEPAEPESGAADLEGLGVALDDEPLEVAPDELVPLGLDLLGDLEAGLSLEGDDAGPDEKAGDDGAGERRQSPRELADMVSDFRSQVDSQVEGDDFETRYNLGIAYREMGLLDEAVGEFQRAAKEPARLFDCAGLLAQCFVDKGLPQLAVSWVQRGLQVEGRSEEEYQELRYELAAAFEASGETGKAVEIYVELYGENARLRDVAEKVKKLVPPVSAAKTGASGEASDPRRGVVLPWKRG